jgi:hypothetical protein
VTTPEWAQLRWHWFEGAPPDRTHTVTPTDMLAACAYMYSMSALHPFFTLRHTDPERSSTPAEYQQLGYWPSTAVFLCKSANFFSL